MGSTVWKSIAQGNEEDVPAYREYFDALLDKQPSLIGGKTYGSMAEVEEARRSGLIRERRYRNFLDRLAKRVLKKIIGNGSTAEGLRKMKATRHRFGNQTPEQVRGKISPTSTYAERVGFAHGLVRTTLRGGGFGGGILGLVELGTQIFTPGDIDWVKVGRNTGVGIVGGGVGGAVEFGTDRVFLRAGVRNGVARSAGAGGASGAIAAPVIEIGMMLFDENQYSAEDYFARGSRAAVGGAISGVLAHGASTVPAILYPMLTGAEIGGAGGPIGIVAGIIVGFFAYVFFDDLIGDEIERTARSIFRTFKDRPIMALQGPWQVEDFGFFQVVDHYLEQEEPHLVQLKGPYISYLSPINDDEILFVEVVPANGNSIQLFEGRESMFVPAKMLTDYL